MLFKFQIRISLIILIFFSITFSNAQKTNVNSEKLAIQYYEQKEYEKANVFFEELFDKSPANWYLYYFKSLVEVKEYSKAEKITKKQLKTNKYNVYLNVYLGHVYKLQHEDKKEKECYEKAIKELTPMQPFILNLATAFIEEQLYHYALQVYNKARKNSPDYPYFYERAEIYKLMNDPVATINEYLDALEFRESELETVQMHLQNSLGYDDEEGGIKNPLLKQELQKRILKQPDNIVLSEFLIFILKQQKDFEGAFVHCKALDKRLKEEGKRVYDLGKICVGNSKWSTAKHCFDYLAEKGPNYIYYNLAIIEGLNVDYLMITQKAQPNQDELRLLEGRLTKANEKYKEQTLNMQIIRNLVSLKAFYLNKTEEAISLLEDFLASQGLDASTKAEYKLLLGDIYLLKGEIWEASLLYSQVEKDYKYEPIGQDAKFRNAKLSYYAGDFA